MGKRGPKPGHNAARRIAETWRPELAYAVGLLATDGCLARNQKLIDLTSKDREQLENFVRCLGVPFPIVNKVGGNGKTYLRVQFKSVYFYDFLLSVGLTPAKSKTIGVLAIPQDLFWDFLRGAYDGDGSSYAYWDRRWRSSYMFYTEFVSASKRHVDWLQREIYVRLGIRGHITHGRGASTYQLKYAKAESLKLLRKMYPTRGSVCLSRKRLKIEKILGTVGLSLWSDTELHDTNARV